MPSSILDIDPDLIPKTLEDILTMAGCPFQDDLEIQHLPLNTKGDSYHIITAISTFWPLLHFRHTTCQQMMNSIEECSESNQQILAQSPSFKLVKDFQAHANNPILKTYLLDQVKVMVVSSRARATNFIQDWWNQHLLNLKEMYEEILVGLKKDDALLTEKLNSLGTLYEIAKEKMEKDSELKRKAKEEHDAEVKRLTEEIRIMCLTNDKLRENKAKLLKEQEVRKTAIEKRQREEEQLKENIQPLKEEIAAIQKERENIHFYTMEDFRRYRAEYDLIVKMSGWSFLLGQNRKGRERWLAYENLTGFGYLNTLKVYFEIKHGTWTLAKTEAHEDVMPIISVLVDMFPEQLPSSEQELSKACQWMAHRWDYFFKLNEELSSCKLQFWTVFKYETTPSVRLRIIQKCFQEGRYRIYVHFLFDVWNTSIFVHPTLEYKLQIFRGKVDNNKLFHDIHEAYEQRDVRAIFAAVKKVIDESN